MQLAKTQHQKHHLDDTEALLSEDQKDSFASPLRVPVSDSAYRPQQSPLLAPNTILRSVYSTLRFIVAHPLNSNRPLSALWRFARWQIESRLRSEIEFRWIEGSKLIACNGMTGATGNIYCGLHEFVDMAFLLHLLRPDDLFVDVGANIGSYSILASAVCRARTIAVEPDPHTMKFLRRNVEANAIEDRVTLVEAAFGAEPGMARFTVGKDTTNRVTTRGDIETREVQVRTLDESLQGMNPVLIKMDVEGYEAEVIAGACKTLLNPSLLAIQIETVDEKGRMQMEKAGFSQALYEPFERQFSTEARKESRARSHNLLFLRNIDVCQRLVETAESRDILGHRL